MENNGIEKCVSQENVIGILRIDRQKIRGF
jgi:hypothetical protein